MNPADLFAALAAVPRLEGAKCLRRWELFDSDQPDDVAAAIELCGRCPCAVRCRAFVDSQPPNSLSGVVAGELHVWTQQNMRRPRKSGAA